MKLSLKIIYCLLITDISSTFLIETPNSSGNSLLIKKISTTVGMISNSGRLSHSFYYFFNLNIYKINFVVM